ncbi:MAG TPA: autotransporter-associated beta strand repeat-containing protein, partial [Lacipirellula sp.]
LTINKAVSDSFDTTIAGSATNTLTLEGGAPTVTNGFSSVGTGLSIISAPVVLNSTGGPTTIIQGDDDRLEFRGPISGAGGLKITRDANGSGSVVLGAANTYTGDTALEGAGGNDTVYVRLDHPNSIPGGIGATGGTSRLTMFNSVILGLAAGDFLRSNGPDPEDFDFINPGAGHVGWAAYGGDRIVNIGGASDPKVWGGLGIGTLAFSAPDADGMIEFQNPLALGGGTVNRTVRVIDGDAAIDARMTGEISGASTGNFRKNGNGTLALAAANTYSSTNTIIDDGTLVLEHLNAIPATSAINVRTGGVLGLGVADFAADLGTGPGQIFFQNGNAGFAAYHGDRTVTLNGGAQLAWNVGDFIKDGGDMLLAEDDGSSDGMLDFTNPIDVNGLDRTFTVRNGSAVVDARLSGVISGAGGFVKAHFGTLDVAAANTYTGSTTITNGVMLLTNANSIPGGINGGNTGNIMIGNSTIGDGGSATIGLGHGDFTSGLGVGAGQIQFIPGFNGGFSAWGGHRIVNLGGAGAQVVWSTGGFVDLKFYFSADDADGTLEFQNPIDLNGGIRIIATRNGAADVDGVASGVISGVGGTLQKEGPGTLALAAENTYDGGTNILGGRLLVNNTTGSGVGSGDVLVDAGGTLGGTGFVGTAGDTSNVNVLADGRMAPGVDAGLLTVNGDVTLNSGSFFDAGIGGATAGVDFDQLFVNGSATLSGTLSVSLLDGFTPAPGSTYEILSAAGGVTGTFENIVWDGLTEWEVQYGANTATLVAVGGGPAFTADFDEDGDVDSDDLARWTGDFGTTAGALHTEGDADADADVDGADLLAWQRQLGSGLPATPAAAAVPEPAAAALAAFATMLGMVTTRRSRS